MPHQQNSVSNNRLLNNPLMKWLEERAMQDALRKATAQVLKVRFKHGARSSVEQLELVTQVQALESLLEQAVRCESVEAFQAALQKALATKPKAARWRRPRKKKD